jgi:hypothetical protein
MAGVPQDSGKAQDIAGGEWFAQTLAKSTFVVSRPFFSPSTGDALLPVSLKLVYNGRPGVLMGALQLAKITWAPLRETTRQNVDTFVVTAEGDIVSSLYPAKIGSKIPDIAGWFPEILSRVSGSLAVPLNGEMKTVGFYHIPQTELSPSPSPTKRTCSPMSGPSGTPRPGRACSPPCWPWPASSFSSFRSPATSGA